MVGSMFRQSLTETAEDQAEARVSMQQVLKAQELQIKDLMAVLVQALAI